MAAQDEILKHADPDDIALVVARMADLFVETFGLATDIIDKLIEYDFDSAINEWRNSASEALASELVKDSAEALAWMSEDTENRLYWLMEAAHIGTGGTLSMFENWQAANANGDKLARTARERYWAGLAFACNAQLHEHLIGRHDALLQEQAKQQGRSIASMMLDAEWHARQSDP